MKNTYGKEQLQQMAKPHFERLGVNKLFATSDGQFFLLENRALLHAAGRNVYALEHTDTYVEHTVTQEDIDDNPYLQQDVNVGDEVEIPEPVVKKPAKKTAGRKK